MGERERSEWFQRRLTKKSIKNGFNRIDLFCVCKCAYASCFLRSAIAYEYIYVFYGICRYKSFRIFFIFVFNKNSDITQCPFADWTHFEMTHQRASKRVSRQRECSEIWKQNLRIASGASMLTTHHHTKPNHNTHNTVLTLHSNALRAKNDCYHRTFFCFFFCVCNAVYFHLSCNWCELCDWESEREQETERER